MLFYAVYAMLKDEAAFEYFISTDRLIGSKIMALCDAIRENVTVMMPTAARALLVR